MSQVPIITIRNLHHTFGTQTLCKSVLTNINLKVYPGEIVLLTGPSGSGKTTLLTLIGALRSAQEGSLQVLGQELLGAKEHQLVQIRSQIGFIFQAHNLLACLSAAQNVRMALRLHKHLSMQERSDRAISILRAVGLGERADYYPSNLSGGQKQRVAIARALVTHPKLILADEPTAALDSKSGRDVVEIMQRLAKEQEAAILLVTHDHRIFDIADRVVHMEDGFLTQEITKPMDATAKNSG